MPLALMKSKYHKKLQSGFESLPAIPTNPPVSEFQGTDCFNQTNIDEHSIIVPDQLSLRTYPPIQLPWVTLLELYGQGSTINFSSNNNLITTFCAYISHR
jgi:hypothetical protein